MEWRDYGESSLTLLAVHCGISKAEPSIPYDPSDFKRCVHLFECLGMDRMDSLILIRKTADKYKIWEPFLKNWDKLMKLYNKEEGNDIAPKLCKAIQKLRQIQNNRRR